MAGMMSICERGEIGDGFPWVSMEDYRAAVEKLLELESWGCGSSYVAASVLLCAHDSAKFRLDLRDLCRLDNSNLKAALTVILGRVVLLKEPHMALNRRGASDQMAELSGKWQRRWGMVEGE